MIAHNNDNQDKDYLNNLPTHVLKQQIVDGYILSTHHNLENSILELEKMKYYIQTIDTGYNEDDIILMGHIRKLKEIVSRFGEIKSTLNECEVLISNIIE